MQIAIIGAGHVGRALGTAWARLGHSISYGVPRSGDLKHAGLLGRVETVAQSVAGADVIVLAVPWHAVEAALTAAGDLG